MRRLNVSALREPRIHPSFPLCWKKFLAGFLERYEEAWLTRNLSLAFANSKIVSIANQIFIYIYPVFTILFHQFPQSAFGNTDFNAEIAVFIACEMSVQRERQIERENGA